MFAIELASVVAVDKFLNVFIRHLFGQELASTPEGIFVRTSKCSPLNICKNSCLHFCEIHREIFAKAVEHFPRFANAGTFVINNYVD